MLGGQIKWVAFNAGPSAIEALFADAIDATYVGPNPAINGFLKSRGEKFVVIAGSASGGAGLVLREDSGIGSEKDFANKIIATPQLGNTQDVAARQWFTSKGYKFKEKGGNLQILPLANPDQLTMFKKKEIHGAWTVEPWVSRLEIEGGGKLFLDEKTLWPNGNYPTTLLIVNRAFLASHPQSVKQLLAAHVKATQQINRDKTAAALVLNNEIKKETGKELPERVITRALDRVDFTWDPYLNALSRAALSAHHLGYIRVVPDLKGIASLDLLNEVLGEINQPLITQK
jgi:NitT/TauT family transport system substrate-binding protein